MESILITIIVIAYNSEKTILETLNSIENQTYKNFEIIICDDSSQDKTLEICKKWKEAIKEKIKNIKILNSSVNQGTVKNINKGIKVAKGEWIKLIAADDILLNSCIEDNLNYIKQNSKIKICFSKTKTFNLNSKDQGQEYPNIVNEKYMFLSVEEQYKKLRNGNFLPAPSSFINKDIFQKYGLFDERIPLIEDYPYWLKLTSKGEKLYYLPKVTVLYRIGEGISTSNTQIINNNFFVSYKKIYQYYLKENINFLLRWHYIVEIFSYNLVRKIFNNKKNKFSIFVLKLFKLLDLYVIIRKLKNEKIIN